MSATSEKGREAAQAARESPTDYFKRIAPKRVQNVLKDLDILAACTDKPQYDYSDEQAEKIVTAIQEKVDALSDAFQNGGRPSKRAEFNL